MAHHLQSSTIIDKLTKPTSNINISLLTEFIDNTDTNIKSQNKNVTNLWQFSKIYTVGNIPIIDFLIVYIFLYLINSIYQKYNYKLVLIATIPFTIILNIFINKNIKISWIILLVLMISIYFLFYEYYNMI